MLDSVDKWILPHSNVEISVGEPLDSFVDRCDGA